MKNTENKKPKILFFDIETSLMILTSFSLVNKEYISHNAILDDWYIICASWKWLGQKEVYSAIALDKNDKFLVQRLRDLFAEADIIVMHNGDRFDVKKLNARMIYWGIKPFAPPKTVDTLKVARKEFKFSSNRLDYIGKYLGVGGKLTHENNLWTKVLQGDIIALEKMVKYNKRDVTLLEKVYLKLRPYIRNHPNMNLFLEKDFPVCTNCGSKDLAKAGTRKTLSAIYQRLQCKACSAWMQSKPSLKTVEVS